MVKKKYTFTLDPEIIAEIEKLDKPKSAIVESALQLYLHQNDNKQPTPGVISDFYTKAEMDDKIKDIAEIMRDISKDQSSLSKRIDAIQPLFH